jgi:hypothetical protein
MISVFVVVFVAFALEAVTVLATAATSESGMAACSLHRLVRRGGGGQAAAAAAAASSSSWSSLLWRELAARPLWPLRAKATRCSAVDVVAVPIETTAAAFLRTIWKAEEDATWTAAAAAASGTAAVAVVTLALRSRCRGPVNAVVVIVGDLDRLANTKLFPGSELRRVCRFGAGGATATATAAPGGAFWIGNGGGATTATAAAAASIE